MFDRIVDATRGDPLRAAAILVATAGIGAIASAWFAQFVLELAPCSLCFAQRTPYYIAVPVAVLVIGTANRFPQWVSRGAVLALAALMVWGGIIAAYHAGVEWHWWAGPDVCADGLSLTPTSAIDLLKQLQSNPVVPCDVPALVILGLSMAGWNALLSAGLAITAMFGIVVSMRK